MSDQSLPPQFVDDAAPLQQPVRPQRRPRPATTTRPVATRPAEKSLSFWQTLDKPLMLVVGVLMAIGLMMIYSTTFDWSFQDFGNPAAKAIEQGRNMALGIAIAAGIVLFGYRRVRRLAVPILLVAIAFLLAVQFFGDEVFNARRSLLNGRFQPGESAELAMAIYMAAWLGAKNTRIRSITYGLIPFAMLVGFVGGLVILQPDLSTAATIFIVCGVMFFLAGADLVQLAATGAIAVIAAIALVLSGNFIYAQGRLPEFFAGLSDITLADYHVVQAYIAFDNGGWFGVGLGESLQKFNAALPAPHTDSIFAIIGEELGIAGAGLVVVLFVLLVGRGFTIARRAPDAFGALLACGITIWIVTKALLNIAVMLGLVPPTGITLPFISFGGSSLVTMLAGVGLLLSVQRATIIKAHASERRVDGALTHHSRRDRRTRVSGAVRSGRAAPPDARPRPDGA